MGSSRLVIRVHRCRVAPGVEGEFSKGIRDKAVPAARALTGIEYSAFGRRLDGQDHHFINVTIWHDYEQVRQQTGDSLDARLIFDGEAQMIVEDSIEFYEVIGSDIDAD